MIIVCYAIDNMKSYQSVDDWIEMIDEDENAKNLPLALLATKKDLVDQ